MNLNDRRDRCDWEKGIQPGVVIAQVYTIHTTFLTLFGTFYKLLFQKFVMCMLSCEGDTTRPPPPPPPPPPLLMSCFQTLPLLFYTSFLSKIYIYIFPSFDAFVVIVVGYTYIFTYLISEILFFPLPPINFNLPSVPLLMA